MKATYSKLIKIFKQAGCKYYADEIRRLAQLSNNELVTDDFSGEEVHSQIQTYPAHEQQLLPRLSPSTSKFTEVIVITEKGSPACAEGKNQQIPISHTV